MYSSVVVIYSDQIASMRCSIASGKINIAKPLLVLSMIRLIELKVVRENKFSFDAIETIYNDYQQEYNSKTPIQYPFYFLSSEPFYHICWKDTPIKTRTPSRSMIRERIECVAFDNALWDLLQENSSRNYLIETLKRNFLY